MQLPKILLLFVFFSMVSLLAFKSPAVDWGVFGHRKINRMAVYTMPPELIKFYKSHLEQITEQSISPDKRRYSVKEEATRHYIDVDHWGEYPFPHVPRNYRETIYTYSDIYYIGSDTDTIYIKEFDFKNGVINDYLEECTVDSSGIRKWFHETIAWKYEEREWMSNDVSLFDTLECQSLKQSVQAIYINDNFTEYGILPFHLETMQRRLTDAFYKKDAKAIVWLSAEIGHYISDAHVPLHTTENYNGQLTDQLGLHAFWESRLPELFADDGYDYFVGKPTYIENVNNWAWGIVLDSHTELDNVLKIEKRLSKEYPADKQFCYEDRFDRTVKTQCAAYCEAYHLALDGMVEDRMRDAIQAVASSWYSAWINAGQPDMSKLMDDYIETDEEIRLKEELEKKFKGGEIIGRKHTN